MNCINKSLNSIEDVLNQTETRIKAAGNQSSFTSNFWLRTYASGCSHCVSSHLTTFAGGFIVLPNAIDFNHVLANASFLQNPVIYSTVIALICLYILLGVWARWMDKKDEDKCGITLIGNMKDHMNKEHRYIYEIICFTGNRLNAGTKSKVLKNFIFNLPEVKSTREESYFFLSGHVQWFFYQ